MASLLPTPDRGTALKSNAWLGDKRLPYGINRLSWGFNLRTSSIDTLGGRVVQILGIDSDRLQIQASAGSRENLLSIAKHVSNVMEYHIQTHRPVDFIVASRGWRYKVFCMSLPQIGWELKTIAYPFSLVMQVQDDFGLANQYLLTDHFDHIRQGIGYNTDFHGGADVLDQLVSGEFVFESFLDDPLAIELARLADYQAGGTGFNQAPPGVIPSGYFGESVGFIGNFNVDVGDPIETGSSPQGFQNRKEVYSFEQRGKLAYRYGITSHQALTNILRISQRESGGNAFAYYEGPRDKSYGWYQINMKEDDPSNPGMGANRRRQFGLTSNEELFNPDTNTRIMSEMSNKGANLNAWGRTVDPLRGTSQYAAEASAAAQAVINSRGN